jgi:hypothetical protein
MVSDERVTAGPIECSPFHAGMKVTPHVRLVEPLAVGGMGELWVGRHLPLATDVVVKFVRPCFHGNATVIARFQREARAAARLSSPHVVRYFDHGLIDEPHPYIIMERLQGMSLADALVGGARFDLRRTAELIRQLASAVSEAHAANIIHRDIKPENVFLCDVDGGMHVKLLDFGVAAITGGPSATLTQPGMLIGTPSYMSPEVVLYDAPADEHADIWAVAAVAYEVLTGAVAFDGETVGAVCAEVARCEPLPPSAHDPRIPPAVDAWFARAFDRDPGRRFQSARELALSFAAVVERGNLPVLLPADDERITLGATAVSRRDHEDRASRGWRLPAAALALLFVGVAGSRLLFGDGEANLPSLQVAVAAAASTAPPAPTALDAGEEDEEPPPPAATVRPTPARRWIASKPAAPAASTEPSTEPSAEPAASEAPPPPAPVPAPSVEVRPRKDLGF